MNGSVTPAAQVIVCIIPIVALVLAFVLIFFAILWHHREVKLQIKNQNYAPFEFNWKAFTFLSGLSMIAVGVVLTGMFFVNMPDGAEEKVLGITVLPKLS